MVWLILGYTVQRQSNLRNTKYGDIYFPVQALFLKDIFQVEYVIDELEGYAALREQNTGM